MVCDVGEYTVQVRVVGDAMLRRSGGVRLQCSWLEQLPPFTLDIHRSSSRSRSRARAQARVHGRCGRDGRAGVRLCGLDGRRLVVIVDVVHVVPVSISTTITATIAIAIAIAIILVVVVVGLELGLVCAEIP